LTRKRIRKPSTYEKRPESQKASGRGEFGPYCSSIKGIVLMLIDCPVLTGVVPDVKVLKLNAEYEEYPEGTE
jgi:hypothetical protein